MSGRKRYIRFRGWLPLAVLVLPLFALFAPVRAQAGTIDSTYKYAWGERIGWINFKTTSGNVQVTSSAITGYAWSANYGWINLAPATSGVKNDGSGTLSGYAWGENLGWINFSGVTINSTGEFIGYASGTVTGQISFNCSNTSSCGSSDFKVKTDWRASSAAAAAATAAVSGGAGPLLGTLAPPIPPEPSDINPTGDFQIFINAGAPTTRTRNVALTLIGGPNTARMAISNDPNFRHAGTEPYQLQKAWDLCTLAESSAVALDCPEGNYAVYARFYTKSGQPSKVVSAAIILSSRPPPEPLPTPTPTPSPAVPSATPPVGPPPGLPPGPPTVPPPPSIITQLPGFIARLIPPILLPRPAAIEPVEIPIEELLPKQAPLVMKNTFDLLTPQLLPPESLLALRGGLQLPPPPTLAQGVEPPLSGTWKLLAQQPIARETELALRGEWDLISAKPLETFVLAPLPATVQMLAEKFPALEKTFDEVGVTKLSDLRRLEQVKLILPGVTEAASAPGAVVKPSQLALPKSIPVSELPIEAKERLPSDIIFAKTAGGTIDLNIALSVTEYGLAEQSISTISGTALHLLIKPSRPATHVRGSLVFTSRPPPAKSKRGVSLRDAMRWLVPTASAQGNSTGPSPYPLPQGEENRGDGNSDNTSLPDLSSEVRLRRTKEEGSNLQPTTYNLPTQQPVVEQRLVLMSFDFADPDGDNIFTADIQTPVVAGKYQVIAQIEYAEPALIAKEIRLTTVIDPEGYLYEQAGDKEARIPGAIVSLYRLNPQTRQYELWPADEYQQENPLVTDVTGKYAFLVPAGMYYLSIYAPGYLKYEGRPFEVREGSGVHTDIELTPTNWYVRLLDWKTLLLVITIMLLLYNFYRDKVREQREQPLHIGSREHD